MNQLLLLLCALQLGCGASAPTQKAPPPAPQIVGPPTFYVSADAQNEGDGSEPSPFKSLNFALETVPDGALLILSKGNHKAIPKPYIDPTCGNCQDDEFYTNIDTTVGFHIKDKSVSLRGVSRNETVLQTGAGYGLLIEGAKAATLENLTISGGVRSANGKATDGAVVVRHSKVSLDQVDLADNDDRYQGQPDPIVGIAGLVAREGAIVSIRNSRILNSSWDGIAAYRSAADKPDEGPILDIANSEIGCNHRCIKQAGRGVGIGITWNAKATINNVEVHDYWKGIGSFGTTVVSVQNSIIRNQYGWGLVATAESTMTASNNTIADNGTVGVAVWDEKSQGSFRNNVIVGNGWNPKEWVGKKTGLWLNNPDFDISHNLFWDNRPLDVCTGGTPEPEITPCEEVKLVGERGNIRAQPLFAGDSFAPAMGSPMIDAGAAGTMDADGSVADLGAFGGKDSKWTKDRAMRHRIRKASEPL